jgi:hypothetical protein
MLCKILHRELKIEPHKNARGEPQKGYRAYM